MSVDLRFSDYDINGHVNNTEYIGFLESAWYFRARQPHGSVKQVKIRFAKEIDQGKKNIQVGWETKDNRIFCTIFDKEALFAQAEVRTSGRPDPA